MALLPALAIIFYIYKLKIGDEKTMNTKQLIKEVNEGCVLAKIERKEIIELLECGEKYKELIVDQQLKIKELEEAIKIQDNLIKEYMAMLNKYEGQGLLIDAIDKEDKPKIVIKKPDIKIHPYLKPAVEKVIKKYKKQLMDDYKKIYGVKKIKGVNN